ncbi:energy transducer TonB [Parvularcula sp. ZS-1/3]|uniref:Protein TonB n=1 Tax=Parvularcula mediterranea TaxID=2732508 RepID=A0A7Y3W4E9_9PROT|nr:energy transducer TonB [Parvularcula mediterranea]NNU15202.1 energy transducer TonB [Parvularcula mediterranea]
MISTKKSARASIPAALAAVFLGSVGSSFAMAQEPALVKAVPPEYPRAAERRDLEGEVIVSIVVGDDGSVSSATVVSATPPGIFDTAATRAVQRWKFEPGKPATLTKKIQFKLTG